MKRRQKFLPVFIILLLIFFNLDIKELKSNVRPEILYERAYPVDIYNFNTSGSRDFSVRKDFPVKPFSANYPPRQTKSQQDQDKCFFKETFRLPADRGQEPAILDYSRIFSGYSPKPNRITAYLPFVLISSKTGHSSRIRPPPVI